MRILLKPWFDRRSWPFDVEQNDTVMDLMTKIYQQEGISEGLMMLICKGRRMQEDTTLEYCRVEDGEMIHLVLRLRGGARTKRTARRFGLYGQKPAPAA